MPILEKIKSRAHGETMGGARGPKCGRSLPSVKTVSDGEMSGAIEIR